MRDAALSDYYPKCALSVNKEARRRQAVAYQFIEMHKCPPKSEWRGTDGVISKIRKLLSIPRCTDLEPIFECILACQADGIPYTGQIRTAVAYKPVVLDVKSFEAQIVADCLEEGSSIQQATNLVNKHRMDNEIELVSESAVYELSRRLLPSVLPIKKLKQGSNDVNSDWAISRHHWIMQLMIRFNRKHFLTAGELLLPDGTTPDYFDEEKLRPYMVDFDKVVWWDETHRKCTVGSATAQAGRKHQVKFKRNEHGKIDLENGTCLVVSDDLLDQYCISNLTTFVFIRYILHRRQGGNECQVSR